MAIYRRDAVIHAPLARVWELYSTVEGLRQVTPNWLGLRIESIDGSSRVPVDGPFEPGMQVTLSIRPFGIGPRVRWTSAITDVERTADLAGFRDVMTDGPFRRWAHTHRFEAVGGGTRITDEVDYELPGPFRPLSPAAAPFFEPLFAYRHRQTARLV